MINSDKIGQFIKKQRKENKMSQDDLAEKLYLTRQAVSSWENGKTVPSIDNIKDLANIFNVSIPEMYQGEIIENKQTVNDIFHSIISLEIKKRHKYTIVLLSLLVLSFVIFTITYFITYYNNITAYMISSDSINYEINGNINKSVNTVYFNLEIDQVVDKFCLTYNDENIVCQTNTNFIIINERSGYNEYLPVKPNDTFEDFINNMYLVIIKNNIEEKIKLNIRKDYQNSNLFASSDERMEVTTNDNYELKTSEVPEKIKNEFKFNKEDDKYYLEYKNDKCVILLIYYLNLFIVQEKYENIQKEWNYDLNSNKLKMFSIYNKENNKLEKLITDFSDKDKNKEKQEMFNYFKNTYLDKYFK